MGITLLKAVKKNHCARSSCSHHTLLLLHLLHIPGKAEPFTLSVGMTSSAHGSWQPASLGNSSTDLRAEQEDSSAPLKMLPHKWNPLGRSMAAVSPAVFSPSLIHPPPKTLSQQSTILSSPSSFSPASVLNSSLLGSFHPFSLSLGF